MAIGGLYYSDIDRDRQPKEYRRGDTLPAGVSKDVRINGTVYMCGNVRIEQGVTLGNNTELWGGDADATLRVRRGTSIDSQCIIRTNGFPVDIGENVTIDAQTKINSMREKGLPYGGKVVIGNDSQIGSNVLLGNNIEIGRDVFIGPNTTIHYWTTIGDGTQIYKSDIGAPPQDDTWVAELKQVQMYLRQHPQETGRTTVKPTYTKIGDDCVINIGCRISRGTQKTSHHTTTLDDCVKIHEHSHVGHDCHLMRHTKMGTGCKIAGHVVMHPYSAIGSAVKLDRFVQLGMLAYVVSTAGIGRDVPPCCTAGIMKAFAHDQRFMLNRKGIKNFFRDHGAEHPAISQATERAARPALRVLIERYAGAETKPTDQNFKRDLKEALKAHPESAFIKDFIAFMTASWKRGETRGLNL
jgi:acyl-[acyl carrier protein]--UDP-N-acetylglucosamine O-acyltransferase